MDKEKDSLKKQNPLQEEYAVAKGAYFPIVGIGASAGGLAAVESLFTNLPRQQGTMAFILVQHLSPDHKSILSELLKKYTGLQVFEAQDRMPVKPGCIYVAPPNKELVIRRGILYLKELKQPRVLRLPIDTFLRSLAQDQRERSVCIILSGGGTDGTLGLKAIKGEGGMAMVQEPDTAQYKDMPLAAIATNMADYVLPPEKMPEQLIAHVQHIQNKGSRPTENFKQEGAQAMHDILTLLHAQTGHDFSGYKMSTVSRRIERRLAVNQIEHLDDYFRYLQHNELETEALFRELLVGVTSFFRDLEAFEALREKVIPCLFKNKIPGNSVRVWVPGCSTGEEPYSLAILLSEYLEKLKQPVKVQVFATDIDNRAIDYARRGTYPASIASYVSPERLKHYFTGIPDGNSYQIQKNIRNMLVFAEHNVTKDPPFSKLDLISCRNLLIFMDGELQKKVLHLFNYALNPEGFLFLGTSETTGELVDLFTVVDQKQKIYQSRETVSFYPGKKFYPLYIEKTPQESSTIPSLDGSDSIREEFVQKMLLQYYTPACVVIDKQGEILYIHGRTGKYLEPAPGKISLDITQMAREGLRLELSAAIRKAITRNQTVYYQGLRVKGDGATTTIVNLTVRPMPKGALPRELFLVVFKEVDPFEEVVQKNEIAASIGETAAAGETAMNERVIVLEQELRHKEEYLQTVIEELETSNEELQSTNEEFQSTNEELETSKEELQSLNEELMTVNVELQNKLEEFYRINNDMNNMLAGTGMGTIFVDHQLRIQRFTPPAVQVINLIQSDIGRPVNHIVSNLANYDRLEEDLQNVLNTLIPYEVEVRTKKGLWYLMRILPYRTVDNVIEGAVINFIDITEMKHMQKMSRLAVVVRDSNDAITMLDLEGKILAWNPGAERIYGWNEVEASGMNIIDTVLVDKQPEVLEMLKKVAESEKLQPFITWRLNKKGETFKVWTTASVLINEDKKPYAIAITERQSAESC